MRWGRWCSFDLSKTWDPFRIREALNFHTKPHPVAIIVGRGGARRFRGAVFGARRGTTNTASSTGARRPALDDYRVWHCPMPLDAEAMDAGGAAHPRPARFHHLSRRRMPGQVAGQDARPLDVSREGEMIVVTRQRPQLPAFAGALDGRLAEAGRRGQMDAAPSSAPRSMPATAAAAARWRRRTGCIW